MLERLRRRTHRVVTAIAVAVPRRKRSYVSHAITKVTMRSYTADEIEASIARGDPFDKAAAYAIQDERLAPVAEYEGCYCNVVGLPLWPAIELLEQAGAYVPPDARERLPEQCANCPLSVN